MANFKRWPKLSNRQKLAAAALVVLIIIVLASGSSASNRPASNSGQPPAAAIKSSGQAAAAASGSSQTSAKAPAQAKSAPASATTTSTGMPKYYLVGTYGDGGKTYVISPSDATVAKLTLVGQDLNRLYGSDSFARIGIYTDPAQAQIGASPDQAAALTGDSAANYDAAYVAQFNVNKSTGLKQFTITLGGQTTQVNL